jgi:hypothetical protein
LAASARLEPWHKLLIAWHLCSFDAPTVAAVWTWFVARSCSIELPPASILAMFLAVWILYAADRLLDARGLASDSDPEPLEARHRFHFRHRRPFRLGILLASAALAPLLLTIPPAALRLYLVAGVLLFAWFILIHVAPSHLGHEPHRLPKELAVGAFFAAATFIPTVARQPSLRHALLLPAVLFAALCSLNCLYIYAWEHASGDPSIRAHPTTRIALRRLQPLSVLISLAALALASAALRLHHTGAAPICLAMTLSSALLLLLHRARDPLHSTRAPQRTILRAAADLVLLTPLAILPFLR